MSNLYPIWTPQDSIDTAHHFHLELDNAERGQRVCQVCDRSHLVTRIDPDGVCRRCRRRIRVGQFLFTQSRHRRAAVMDGLAVGLLMLTMALLGAATYYTIGGAR